MIKAIIFMVVGAVGAYLYMNPGDVDGAKEMMRQGANSLGQVIVEATE